MDLSRAQCTLQTFWHAWRDKNAGALPSRRDMDVRDNRRHFPYVVVFDILSEPLDFRYRLVGTAVRENTYGDYTGKTLREMDGKGPGSKIWEFLDTTRLSSDLMLKEVPYVGPNQTFMRSTLLFMPLADDNRNPDKVFLVSNFISKFGS